MSGEWEWLDGGGVGQLCVVQDNTPTGLTFRSKTRKLKPQRPRPFTSLNAGSGLYQYQRESLFNTTPRTMDDLNSEFYAGAEDDRQRYLRMTYVLAGAPLPKPRKVPEDHRPPEPTTQESARATDDRSGDNEMYYATTWNDIVEEDQLLDILNDTGCYTSCVHPELVRTFEWEVKVASGTQCPAFCFHGDSWTPTTYVEIDLVGAGSKSIPCTFFLAPKNCPHKGLILGDDFREHHQGQVSKLFHKKRTMSVLMQNPRTTSEQAAIDQSRTEADRKRVELKRKKELKQSSSKPNYGFDGKQSRKKEAQH